VLYRLTVQIRKLLFLEAPTASKIAKITCTCVVDDGSMRMLEESASECGRN
jgi:hypothetical protein